MLLFFAFFPLSHIFAENRVHPHEDANFTQSGNDEDGYLYKIENSLLNQDKPNENPKPAKHNVKQMLLDLSSSEKKLNLSTPMDLTLLRKRAKETDKKLDDIFQSLIEKNKEEQKKFDASLAALEKKTPSFVEKESPVPNTHDLPFNTITKDADHFGQEYAVPSKSLVPQTQASFMQVTTKKPEASLIEKKDGTDLENLIHSLNPLPHKKMSLPERIKAEEDTATSLEKKYHFTLPKWIQEIQTWAHGLGKNAAKGKPAVPPASLGQFKAMKNIRPVSFGKELLHGTSVDPATNPEVGSIFDDEFSKIMAQNKLKQDVASGKLPFRPGENWKPKPFDQIMKERALKMRRGDPDPHVSSGTFYLQTGEEKKPVAFDFESVKKRIEAISSSLVQHMKPLPFQPKKEWHPKLPSDQELKQIRDEATKEAEESLLKAKPFSFSELQSENSNNNADKGVPVLTSFTETTSHRHHRRHRKRRQYDDDDDKGDEDEFENDDSEEQSEDESGGDSEEKDESSFIHRKRKSNIENDFSTEGHKNLGFPGHEVEQAHYKAPKWKPLPFGTDELVKRFKEKWESGSPPNLDMSIIPQEDSSFLQVASDHKDVDISAHVPDKIGRDEKDVSDVLEPFRNLKITGKSLMKPWSFGTPSLGRDTGKASFVEAEGKKAVTSSTDEFRKRLKSMSLEQLEKEKESIFSKLDKMLKHSKKRHAANTSFFQKHHAHHNDASFKPVPIRLSHVEGTSAPSSFVQDYVSTDLNENNGSLVDLANTIKATEVQGKPEAPIDGPDFANDPTNPLQIHTAPLSSFSSMNDPYATLRVPTNQNPFAMEGGEHADIGDNPSFPDVIPKSPEEAGQLLSKSFGDEASFLQTDEKVNDVSKYLNKADMKEVHGALAEMQKAVSEKVKISDPFKIQNPAVKLLADIEAERVHRKKRLEEMDAKRARGEDPGLFASDGFASSLLETSADKASDSSMLQAMKDMENSAKAERNSMNKVTRQFHALKSELDNVLGQHEIDNLPAALKHLPVNGGVTDHHLKALEKLKNLEIKQRPSHNRDNQVPL